MVSHLTQLLSLPWPTKLFINLLTLLDFIVSLIIHSYLPHLPPCCSLHTSRSLLLLFPLSVMLIVCISTCMANFLTSFRSLLKSYLPWLPHLEVLFPPHPGFPSMLYLFFLSNILLSLAVEGKLHEGRKFCLFYLLICLWCLEYLWLIITAQ